MQTRLFHILCEYTEYSARIDRVRAQDPFHNNRHIKESIAGGPFVFGFGSVRFCFLVGTPPGYMTMIIISRLQCVSDNVLNG